MPESGLWMVLLAVASAVLFSAEPSGTAVVVSRRTNVSTADASALALSASAMLRDLEVPLTLDADAAATRLAKLGLQDPATCAGRKPCVAELGAQLKVAWVIALSVSQIDADRSIALELIRISDQTVVEKDALILPARAKLTSALLSSFAQRCRAVLKPDAPVVPPVVTPAVVRLTPLPKNDPPPPPEVVVVPQKSHTTSWVLGGGAVVAIGAAATLFALAMSTRGELSRGTQTGDVVQSELLGSQAVAKNDTANLELGLAGVAAGVGVGLGTAAVLTW